MVDFPAVPLAPGVPPLNRVPGELILLPTLLFTDVLSLLYGLLGPQWGIFQGGMPVISPDSILEVDYKNSSSISDYPLERGAFDSYNKVANPFDARVVMTVGGSMEARAVVLQTIDMISRTLDLYDVVTPEKTYTSVNIIHYDYRRTASRGLGLLKLDVWLREVRVTALTDFTNTKMPSGADPVNNGATQTLAPSAGDNTAKGNITVTPTSPGN